jgi:hypothetical protein
MTSDILPRRCEWLVGARHRMAETRSRTDTQHLKAASSFPVKPCRFALIWIKHGYVGHVSTTSSESGKVKLNGSSMF